MPTLAAGTLKGLEVLLGHLRFGRAHGIGRTDLLHFTCAAFDVGPADALAGVRAGNVDAHTAGGDFSADVLARSAMVSRWLEHTGVPA